MKKIIPILILCFSINLSLNAQQQNEFDQLFKEMERMQQEMFQQFGAMNPDSMGFQLFFDTLMVQDFGDIFGDFEQDGMQPLDSKTFEGLFEQMQEQLSQMDQSDWDQFSKLFDNFGMMPAFPPQHIDPQQDNGVEALPKKKDGSKRKIYKM